MGTDDALVEFVYGAALRLGTAKELEPAVPVPAETRESVGTIDPPIEIA